MEQSIFINCKTLKKLKNELRTNTNSAESDLGGSDHRYLGLVLTNEEYTRIMSDHPFVAPKFSDTLRIPASADTVDTLNLRENQTQNISIYSEYHEVERALMRHITTAIEA